MATNHLPEWSTNFPLNLPKPARALLGKLSVKLNARSVGHATKRLIGRGIVAVSPAFALEWAGINKRYYQDAMIEGVAAERHTATLDSKRCDMDCI
jgi:hypothetical protein